MMPNMETVCFQARAPGPRLLVLGAVHGNETCGPIAIRQLIDEFRQQRLTLRSGAVTFVPVVNGPAHDANVRARGRDLNRGLAPRPRIESDEDAIGNALCDLMTRHDVLVDLHSFRSEGEPFVFFGPSDNDGALEPFHRAAEEESLAAVLGPALAIHGWLSTYASMLGERAEQGTHATWRDGCGTTEFMRSVGGYGVTVECGQHAHPDAPVVARQAVLRAMHHLALLDGPPPAPSVACCIALTDALIRHDASDAFSQPWRTGSRVEAGERLIERAAGDVVHAAYDGYVVFPNAQGEVGDSMCLFGVDSVRGVSTVPSKQRVN
jgi:N2-acetyl-L-2,4-diaminobutanoate deacetylase